MSRRWGYSIMPRLWDNGVANVLSAVFYAPLDGSRLDYHPCGREQDHPAYIDPATGEPATPPERAFAFDLIRLRGIYDHRCGRCGETYFGPDAAGKFALHDCDHPFSGPDIDGQYDDPDDIPHRVEHLFRTVLDED